MRRTVAAAGRALLVLGAEAALAQSELTEPCRLELTGATTVEWRGLHGRGYDVTSQEQEFETLPVAVRHEGAACEYFIAATPLSSGGEAVLVGAGDRLSWDLRSTPTGPSLVSPDFLGPLAGQLAGRFKAGAGTQPLSLFFTIPPGQFVRGGHYQGEFVLRLFRRDGGAPELLSELPVAAIAAVPSILQVRSDDFTGGSREISIDLGNLNDPAVRAISFDILSNTAVAVDLTSAAGGVLAHQFGGPGVPYRLRLNGAAVPLGGPARERLDMAASDGSRAAVVEISVPSTAGPLPAGRYSDTLTMTFIAES
ncbi:hypothetical protein GRI75_10800 [Altererythrobacter soli]|uniref:Spore coat protein U domain-containing protein n=1 Tax=Croceibacterium soli TaxID=1739690 RepID=A0A6I4UTZ4_9SPHN|nr:hypothetical protein [Croceibacterium soli]MXP42128.1 hypothetical protein [Croceibacterium soli]